ncbi:MAG: beta-1,6-N-acetylglucosaminyltransferase [Acidobacteriota bacterium]
MQKPNQSQEENTGHPPVRIAYLIMAHSGLDFLDRLIASLNDDNSAFYVHVDKKADRNYVSHLTNVAVLSDRSDVNWACYSQTQAEVSLLQRAIEFHSDYYILISGADYPIRPRQFLYDLLSSGNEFISTCKVPTAHKPLSRFESHYFEYDRRARSAKSYGLRLTEAAVRVAWKKKTIPFELYAGSSWFALTRAAVMHVLSTLEEDPRYEGFFKTCLCADEAMFQTILANSRFKDRITHNLTYTDWSTNPAPAVIGDKHIELFKKQVTFTSVYGEYTPFFARKFDPGNTRMLDLVDRQLRQ